MIARLSGTLVEREGGVVIVDVGGVGYQVAVPLTTACELGEPGGPIVLHVHTHVREDSLALFGFGTVRERDLFSRLLAVSGIGPKTALAALSGLGCEDLIDAVQTRDVTRLASIPGIGRKTAERLVVDLVDRLDLKALPTVGARSADGGHGLRQDLVSALVNLGYNARAAADAAAEAMKAAPAPPRFETLLRATLRILSR